jgi:hypothetical protein
MAYTPLLWNEPFYTAWFNKINSQFNELYTADGQNVKLTWNQTIAGNKVWNWFQSIWTTETFKELNVWANNAGNQGISLQNKGSGWSQLSFRNSAWSEEFAITYLQATDKVLFYNGSTDFMEWDLSTWDIIHKWQNWTSAWTSYTPTVTFGTSTGISVIFARYKQIGKTCTVNFQINISTPDTSIREWTISLPISWPFYQSSWSVSLNDWWVFVSAAWWDIDWTNFKIVKIWANFSWFLVIRGSATYETN